MYKNQTTGEHVNELPWEVVSTDERLPSGQRHVHLDPILLEDVYLLEVDDKYLDLGPTTPGSLKNFKVWCSREEAEQAGAKLLALGQASYFRVVQYTKAVF